MRRFALKIGTCSHTPIRLAFILVYESITPFGEPVVPDVYMIRAMSLLRVTMKSSSASVEAAFSENSIEACS